MKHPHQIYCSCGEVRNQCSNYITYRYDCNGIRVDGSGSFFSAPFGCGIKKYPIGPNFDRCNSVKSYKDVLKYDSD
jgi:hypothetical protein